MFSKQQIIEQWQQKIDAAIRDGQEAPEPGLGLALIIAASALFDQRQRSGDEYAPHWLRVGLTDTKSIRKQIIGVLHDVVEDSDWTLEDLRALGYDERIIAGVDALTKRENESYFDFIVRCGKSIEVCEDDAIDNKLRDLEHNSLNTRSKVIAFTEKQDLKRHVYNISYFYLLGIKKDEISPGTSITDFIAKTPEYAEHPELVNQLLENFSTTEYRFPVPESGTLKDEFDRPGSTGPE